MKQNAVRWNNMNSEDFKQWLKDLKEQIDQEHVQEWKQWLPKISKDISGMMGKLMGMSAEMLRVKSWSDDPAHDMLALESEIQQILKECHDLLVDIQGHLSHAPST